MEKAGLADIFNIELGEDLQLDLEGSRKAAPLLGSLLEAKESIHSNLGLNANEWRDAGFGALKIK